MRTGINTHSLLGRKLSAKQLENYCFVHFCLREREGRADRKMKQDNLSLQQSDHAVSTIQLPPSQGDRDIQPRYY